MALKLRLELPPKTPALKTAIKAERAAFDLKRPLQRLEVKDVETAVATQAARLSSRPVKAFTVAFNDPDYDESARAAATAQQHALDHHVVTIPAAGFAPHFVRSLWHCEMPVVNGHGAAKLLLSGLASQQVLAPFAVGDVTYPLARKGAYATEQVAGAISGRNLLHRNVLTSQHQQRTAQAPEFDGDRRE